MNSTTQKIMNDDATIYRNKFVNGVSYELYASRTAAYVRVYDLDSGNLVSLTKYPTNPAAEAAFNKLVRLA